MAKINVDMSNVEDRVMIPEGDYVCKVAKVTLGKSQQDKPKLDWELVIGTGEMKGKKVFENTSLQPQALFKLRNMMISMGMEVPKSIMTIDTDKFIGKIIGVTVVHEEYLKDGQKKKSSKVGDTWKAAKDANGKWGRAEQLAAKQVMDEMAGDEEVPFDASSDISSDIEEIEI